MKKTLIQQFFRDNALPPNRSLQYGLFVTGNGYTNQTYFKQIAKESSKTISLKTGGINARFSQISEAIAQRALFNINTTNAISVDEKVFCPKNYSPNSVTVGVQHTGAVPSPTLDVLKDVHFFTLQMAITSQGILFYNIIDSAANISSFNTFLQKLTKHIPKDGKERFIILDNGKFHKIDPFTESLINSFNLKLAFNPPLACFLNPIEELFSFISAKVNEEILKQHFNQNFSLSQRDIAKIVHDILISFPSYSFPFDKIFYRANILPPIKNHHNQRSRN